MKRLYAYARTAQEWAFPLCPEPAQWLLNWQGIPGTIFMGVPFAIREYVARLVRFHSLPLQFLDKPSAEQAVCEASQSVRMEHNE